MNSENEPEKQRRELLRKTAALTAGAGVLLAGQQTAQASVEGLIALEGDLREEIDKGNDARRREANMLQLPTRIIDQVAKGKLDFLQFRHEPSALLLRQR